ncbi:hypothetical protein HPB47_023495 [Ixodes persulcatus]|uniref:Uncharacterized protein n=1 Tax=Ixodes persulcatus TaxID=34615 RepID=A0AC60R1T8_IXOPE|nr:hypothetical protein HPB47_023495 [Ixodes persulcatus]
MKEILEELGSVFFPQPPNPPNQTIYSPGPSDGPADEDMPLTSWELDAAITQSNAKSAPGQDGVTTSMLRNAPQEAREAMLQWFNDIWVTSKIPDEWKISCVSPIPKAALIHKGVTDYHPRRKQMRVLVTVDVRKAFDSVPHGARIDLDLKFDGQRIDKEAEVKLLGVHFGNGKHVANNWLNSITRTWKQGLQLIRRISHRMGGAGEKTAKTLVQSVLVSKIMYGIRFYKLTYRHKKKLDSLYNDARRAILGLPRFANVEATKQCVQLTDWRLDLEKQVATHNARLKHTEHGRKIAKLLNPEGKNDAGDIPPPAPPWDLIDLTQSQPIPRNMDAQKHAKRREHYARNHAVEVRTFLADPSITVAYTDAAMKIAGPEAATTAAAIFYSKDNLMGTSISTTIQPRGADLSSPELAEAKAVLFAIESHLRHLEVTQRQHDAKQLYIFTDSQHVIRECKRHGATTCRTIKRIFHTALHLFRVHQTKVCIRWIPGHTGIHGNEAAHDAAARELNSPHPSRVPRESDPSSTNSETADTTSDAWAQLGEDTPSSYEEWIRPFGDSERRVRILRTLLDYTVSGDLRQVIY